MTRGTVLPLTVGDRVQRMLYLAGQCELERLDAFVRKDPGELLALTGYENVVLGTHECPEIFYLLHEHNGGKDPAAPDPADRWHKDESTFTNRTCDCIGGMAWAGGWDRYQPVRFAHLYDGWINTDSMILDAHGPAKCFVRKDRPELGDYVVVASGSPGYAVGHIRGIVDVPLEWDPKAPECWAAIGVVEVAAYDGRANRRTHLSSHIAASRPVFCSPIMTP